MTLETIELMLRNSSPYEDSVKNIIENYKYTVFYGCGAIYQSIRETWKQVIDSPIHFCCDSDPSKWGKFFCDVECISPAALLSMKNECAIFVTVGKFIPVFTNLQSNGCPSVNLIYKYDLLASIYFKKSDLMSISKRALNARSLFADEQSLRVFDTILKRATNSCNDINLMPDIFESSQYFIKEIMPISSDEVFVDVGAYDGDTVEQFIECSSGLFKHIYALELDSVNFTKLNENLSKLINSGRLTAINMGAWDSKGTVTYSSCLTQSHLGQGNCIANVAPIDEILVDKPVTFIKMDIEGAELHALAGAEKTITSNSCKLAICVYHHISHLWEIPLLIHEMLPAHTLYLRHHTTLEYETVCYAVPAIRTEFIN